MKRLLIPFIALALCQPAHASIDIAKIQAPKIQRHLDAIAPLAEKGLYNAACSEAASAELLIRLNYSALTSIDPLWADLYANTMAIGQNLCGPYHPQFN